MARWNAFSKLLLITILFQQEVLTEVLEILNTMTGAFFSRLVSSETLVIELPDVELLLKKVAAGDLKGVIINRESTRFKLPENFAVSEAGNVNVKVRNVCQIQFFPVLA